MITLLTSIIIYPDSYNSQFFVRAEVELRSGTITLYLGPARSTSQEIFIGVKETVNEQVQMRFPALLRTVTIQQNMQDPDPVISDLLRKYQAWLSEVEQIVVDNQHKPGGIATSPYQNGTTQWSLESTWASTGGREVAIEDISSPTKRGHADD